LVILLCLATLPGVATAQQHQHAYAGFQTRAIKALSDQQVADLRAGRGMGLALAAELNGFPGPLHVLELAHELGLSAVQRARMEASVAAMKAETAPIGERLIAQEAELDRLFASRKIDHASLASATRAIGSSQAELRAAHLKYHLSTAESLTPEQTSLYGRLRGYAGAAGPHERPGGHGARP
jgi:Spy/CpxP family protein refolding chaperone